MTTLADLMAELESLGSEQTRKTYTRHGVLGPQFGLSYANFKLLTKRIKKDHALAVGLWATGNHDARTLATMIADPKLADDALLESWASDLDNYMITDAFGTMVAKSPLACEKAEQWSQSAEEWRSTVAWNVMGTIAMSDKTLPDSYFQQQLERIEATIHAAPNRTRYAMNNAVIAIGCRSPKLEALATAAAGRIGDLAVDHGETGCVTPDAAPYIQRVLARKGHLLTTA